MNFLHSEVDAGPDDIVQVTLDKQANVKMMDSSNFRRYQNGDSYRCYGGWATASPVNLRPSHRGRWHVVIDLGGYSGSVGASVSVV